jgi:hypothetical protein
MMLSFHDDYTNVGSMLLLMIQRRRRKRWSFATPKRELDLCLISAVAGRRHQFQNLPISRHFSSGANRDRTGDLLLAKQALSQLSYGPWKAKYRRYEVVSAV